MMLCLEWGGPRRFVGGPGKTEPVPRGAGLLPRVTPGHPLLFRSAATMSPPPRRRPPAGRRKVRMPGTGGCTLGVPWHRCHLCPYVPLGPRWLFPSPECPGSVSPPW